jgi:hypothetical protein
MSDYNPDQPESLHNLLGAYVNVYWNDYQHYWGLVDEPDAKRSEKQRKVHRALDEMGETLRGSMRTLAPDSEAVETIRRLLRSMGLEPKEPLDAAAVMKALHHTAIVRDCISISLAFEVADTLLPAAESRVADLVALIATRRLSPMASKYLERATGLHLWGFEPEAVIMCRSVLEAALVARLGTIIKLDEPPPPLEALNRCAGQLNLLPGYENAKNRRGWRAVRNSPLWDAERLRWTGNQLLHEVPELDADVAGLPDSASAVRALAGLLNRLYPAA